jgi:pimeloyl-ACP methyl ester carboxylesterase
MSDPKPTKHVAYFSYANQAIPVAIWVRGSFANVHTVLFLGTIQIGPLPKIIASSCPVGVAVVQGAPHWYAQPNGNDIPDLIYAFTEYIYDFIQLQTLIRLNIIAESQAAPGALRLAARKNSKIHKIVLLQPLSFNSDAFSATNAQNFDQLLARTRKNFHYQIPFLATDTGLILNYIIMLAFSVRETALGRLKNHYAAGLTLSSVNDLLAVNNIASIIVGENDQIFPYSEIAKTLKDNNIQNIHISTIANIPHSPLSSKAGKILLFRAFNELGIA